MVWEAYVSALSSLAWTFQILMITQMSRNPFKPAALPQLQTQFFEANLS